MFITWVFKFGQPINLMMFFCGRNYWGSALFYGSISQTLSQSDFNPGGSREARKLARKLLELPEVSAVKLFGGMLNIVIANGISYQQATETIEPVMNILNSFNIHG